MTNTDNGNETADLETLPLWKTQFEDGETIVAHAEEIIPSEIKTNIRKSDVKYLKLI